MFKKSQKKIQLKMFLPFLILIKVQSESLESVIIISRHGLRVPPTKYHWDPNDWPDNPGELLSEGLLQFYILGEELRKKYIETLNLIEDYYKPSEVLIKSTEFSRTITSAKAMMMAFYPNGPDLTSETLKTKAVPPFTFEGLDQIIQDMGNEALPFNFQPVFINMEAKDHDFLLLGFSKTCPKVTEGIKDMQNSKHYLDLKLNYEENIRKSLEKMLKTESIDFEEAAVIGDTLETIQLAGMQFPEGLTPELYRDLVKIRDFCNSYMFDVRESLVLSTSEMFNYIVRTFQEKSKKLSFFFSHDTFLISMLKILEVWDEANPPFASTLTFELYKDDSSEFLKILYNDVALNLPKIGSKISLLHFKKIVEDWALNDVHKECWHLGNPKLKMYETNYFHTYIS
jgi:acid phosphatase